MKALFLIIFATFAITQLHAQVEMTKPNIIYIVIDDLNDYVEGFNGHPQVKTPNIKAVADSGTIFLNAFASSPVCAASRAGIFTGKDVAYTGITNNQDIDCIDYRAGFTPGNEIITLPQYLKDSAGYFTAGFDKIFHCDASSNEFDALTADICAKTKSWNKFITAHQGPGINAASEATDEDINQFKWSNLDSAFETSLEDYICTDSVLQTLSDYFLHPELFCDKPLFMSVGFHLPHLPMYVTENYYPEFYQHDIYAEPFVKPYNDPVNAFPYNGIVMPPQPQTAFSDYENLGDLGKNFAGTYIHNGFIDDIESIETLPIIDETLTDEERKEILAESKRANSLWETDLRVPLIITDVRDMAGQVCNSTVSLLDLFPTICDFAQVSLPITADGESYLDGTSLFPLLEQPELNIEKPVLSTYRHEAGEEASCFPQYSVRNNKFHYIRYRNNSGGDDVACDYAASTVEEELYKIGKNREGDPNEWNNLINNEDYRSVVHYLQQWLPDSANYLQTALAVKIHTPELPCYLPNHGNLKLFPVIFDEEGTILLGAALAPYSFKWTNNINDAILSGKIYNFDMASIPTVVFSENSEILFTVEVTEIASGRLIGFNTKVVFINSANTPDVAFDVIANDLENSVDIVDYTLNGAYDATHWEFGDGVALDDYWPATHYYTSPSTYTISNNIDYGNGCQLTSSENVTFFKHSEPQSGFKLYPNPASKTVNIWLDVPAENVKIQIINLLGQTLLKDVRHTDGNLIYLNIEKISAGNYILKLETDEFSATQKIEIF